MKKLYFIIFVFFLNFTISKANEPFVVLEYKGNMSNNVSSKINKNNKFIKDQNYSTSHLVKDGESLSVILKKYYGNSGLNMRIVELSIIEINKHAFVRNNANFMFANKKLYLPSVNEIKDMIYKNVNKKRNVSNEFSREHDIYYFGN